MVVQFLLAGLVLWRVPSLRPQKQHYLSAREYAYAPLPDFSANGRWKIGPCAAATGMDIGLSNASLEFITLAFYSMTPNRPVCAFGC